MTLYTVSAELAHIVLFDAWAAHCGESGQEAADEAAEGRVLGLEAANPEDADDGVSTTTIPLSPLLTGASVTVVGTFPEYGEVMVR